MTPHSGPYAAHGAPNLLFDPLNPSTVLIDHHLLHNIHHPSQCAGRGCPIHHPSPHHMAAWPLHWDNDRALLQRRCPHHIPHPDWDDLAYFSQRFGPRIAITRAYHQCCPHLCCTTIPTRTEEASA